MSDLATVLIPARNEADDIEDCLAAVIAQTYRPLEVIVVDGGSTDGTGARARAALAAAAAEVDALTGSVVDNADGSTPSNLNRGLAAASGKIVCRVDARSILPPGYIDRCVGVLRTRPDVAVVGGAQIAEPRSRAAKDVGMARALNNRWGMGLARYRRAAASGPADTVYLGSFRTEELRAAGGWDTRFATNQDFELNQRLGRRGTVWYEAGLPVGYRARPSVGALFAQYRRFGAWKVRYWRMTGERPRPRQLVLLALPVLGLLGVLGSTAAGGRLRVVASSGGGVALVIFELRGPTGPAGPPAAHGWSLVASVAVAAGWTVGVWQELCRRERPGRLR